MNGKKPLFNKLINRGNIAEKVRKSTNVPVVISLLSFPKEMIVVAIKRLTERHNSLKMFNSRKIEMKPKLM